MLYPVSHQKSFPMGQNDIRNIAIIAHVDHGKTTLVDQIFNACSVSGTADNERAMDSNDLERERGITILSKNTAVEYNGNRINIVDTPGHSDFGGEVERVLRMVDSCLLLVDAQEGPMPQTRFVLKKALEMGHKIILVINKIDKPAAEPDVVIEQTFELFLELGANNDQIEFPIIYASAKNGFAKKNMDDPDVDMVPLLETITEHVPPVPQDNGDFQFQVTSLDYNDYLGRICIGRIFSGNAKVGENVILIGKDHNGNEIKSNHKITKLFTFLGLQRIEAEKARCGDIVAIAGIPEMTIGDTLCSEEKPESLPRIEIEPPTVSMQFWINDSPFAGKEGKFVTSRNIRERLEKELKTNLSLRVEQQGETFQVQGRGELQLAILVENMRREGFELGVSKPTVIMHESGGKKEEPYEEVVMDIPESYTGSIIQELNRRKGIMTSHETLGESSARVKYEMPTRGLIGFRSFFLTESRGEGSLAGRFLEYRPYAGLITGRTRGALVSMENGMTNGYALFNLQDRGEMLLNPQTPVYVGMIIGIHAKDNDLDVNPVKEKKLTNVRASGTDDALRLVPPRKLSLEQAMDFLEEDEILEVTPQSLRLRKKILNPSDRKKEESQLITTF